MTDTEIIKKISEIDNLRLGEKGYVKLWREGDALGVIAFPCAELRFGPFGAFTMNAWSVNRVIVDTEGDEQAAVESLLDWFRCGKNPKPPSVPVQGRFSGWTIECIVAHHKKLLVEKDGWNNSKLSSEFVFKFMNEFQKERWSKRVLSMCGEHSGFSTSFEGDALVLSYQWPG